MIVAAVPLSAVSNYLFVCSRAGYRQCPRRQQGRHRAQEVCIRIADRAHAEGEPISLGKEFSTKPQ
jgi:hypothetical protein